MCWENTSEGPRIMLRQAIMINTLLELIHLAVLNLRVVHIKSGFVNYQIFAIKPAWIFAAHIWKMRAFIDHYPLVAWVHFLIRHKLGLISMIVAQRWHRFPLLAQTSIHWILVFFDRHWSRGVLRFHFISALGLWYRREICATLAPRNSSLNVRGRFTANQISQVIPWHLLFKVATYVDLLLKLLWLWLLLLLLYHLLRLTHKLLVSLCSECLLNLYVLLFVPS